MNLLNKYNEYFNLKMQCMCRFYYYPLSSTGLSKLSDATKAYGVTNATS